MIPPMLHPHTFLKVRYVISVFESVFQKHTAEVNVGYIKTELFVYSLRENDALLFVVVLK